MTNKPTIFIGIPAYNEAGNIKYLLEELLSQDFENIELTEILVVSDGSTDKTVEIAKSINNEKIKVSDDKHRKGVAARQNEIFSKCDADILVMLNADINFENNKFLEMLAVQIVQGADMVAAKMTTVKPKSFMESVFAKSEQMKVSMFEKFNNGDNVYTCHGAARAFSRKFYTNFVFSTAVGEDAYTYFYTKQNNLNYSYSKEAIFRIRACGTPSDYFKQSIRHVHTLKKMETWYNDLDTKKEYTIPLRIKGFTLAQHFIKDPIRISLFVSLFISAYLKSFFTRSKEAWDISSSTKVLHETR